MQVYCYSRLDVPVQLLQTSKSRKAKTSRSWFLNVIIYGTVALQEIIAGFLSKHRMYLQDPVNCDRHVLYRNPHMISLGDVVMTDSFDSPLATLEIERLNVGPDLLAQLMEEQVPLLETEAPGIVITPLFRYHLFQVRLMSSH
jgi:SWI/SNF-related matrix-associated actin-dependent regulator of chromatin subfamily A3